MTKFLHYVSWTFMLVELASLLWSSNRKWQAAVTLQVQHSPGTKHALPPRVEGKIISISTCKALYVQLSDLV